MAKQKQLRLISNEQVRVLRQFMDYEDLGYRLEFGENDVRFLRDILASARENEPCPFKRRAIDELADALEVC